MTGPPKQNPRGGAGFEGCNTSNGNAEVRADCSTRPSKRLGGGAVAWDRPHGLTRDDVLGKPDLWRIFTEHGGVFYIRDPRLPAGSAIAATADDLDRNPAMYGILPRNVADFLRGLVARYHAERGVVEVAP